MGIFNNFEKQTYVLMAESFKKNKKKKNAKLHRKIANQSRKINRQKDK